MVKVYKEKEDIYIDSGNLYFLHCIKDVDATQRNLDDSSMPSFLISKMQILIPSFLEKN